MYLLSSSIPGNKYVVTKLMALVWSLVRQTLPFSIDEHSMEVSTSQSLTDSQNRKKGVRHSPPKKKVLTFYHHCQSRYYPGQVVYSEGRGSHKAKKLLFIKRNGL
jgi:hypothetical protein